VFALIVASLAVQIGINRWNRFFFDALQQKNGQALFEGVEIIIGLAFAAAATAVLLVHARMRLQVKWRQWLTNSLLTRWLSERRFYQLTIVENIAANPEFRLADDVRLATEPLVDFFVGIVSAILTAMAFVGVLWTTGGALTLAVMGRSFTIPGYFVWVAIAYSAVSSVATLILGGPLAKSVGAKNAAEARLRYELTRVRESAENIALIGGDEDERGRISETIETVATRWIGVIRQQARLTWVLNGNSVLASVVPLLVGYPKYLSGELSLGELMQVATAFLQVQAALNWLVENSIRIADWSASARRVVELHQAMEQLDTTIGPTSEETIVLGESPDDSLRIENLSIRLSTGKLMIDAPEVIIPKGQKVLVKGESGTGKSTLIRAMAGLWPWGSGRILSPKGARVAFLPQRPYIPAGTLRRAILYPAVDRPQSDEQLHEVLERCGLRHLEDRLDSEEAWDRILSGGEQQRLAFARLLVDPPDIVIMDEATSALDELSQERMMQFMRNELAMCTVLSVGHRPGLEVYHDREIALVRAPGELHATPRASSPSFAQAWLRWITSLQMPSDR